jgi:hypothetical protein
VLATSFRPTRLLDRWVIAGVMILIVGVLAYLGLVPWGGSPDTKVRLVLLEFDRFQSHLERLCGTHPLQPGALSFQQTGIPETPAVDKRLPRLKVDVSVVVPEPATLLLTVTLPELAAEGIYSVWSSDPIPAGTTLRTKGRCERGTMFWTRLESTLPEERLQAALGVGIR